MADKPVPVKGNHQSELDPNLDLIYVVDIARPSPWAYKKIEKLEPLNYKDGMSEVCLQYIDRIVTNHHIEDNMS